VTEARRFVTYLLKDWPVAEAAKLIVSELATNAIHDVVVKPDGAGGACALQ
jgi:hypothetical protein